MLRVAQRRIGTDPPEQIRHEGMVGEGGAGDVQVMAEIQTMGPAQAAVVLQRQDASIVPQVASMAEGAAALAPFCLTSSSFMAGVGTQSLSASRPPGRSTRAHSRKNSSRLGK